jgi:hypothetical protein
MFHQEQMICIHSDYSRSHPNVHRTQLSPASMAMRKLWAKLRMSPSYRVSSDITASVFPSGSWKKAIIKS